MTMIRLCSNINFLPVMIKANEGSFCISLHRKFRKIHLLAFCRDQNLGCNPVHWELLFSPAFGSVSILLIDPLESIQHGSKYLVATPFLLTKISYGIKFIF